MHGFEQVRPAYHVGDPLKGVVDGHCEMVAHPQTLARQDDVAGALRPGDLGAVPSLGTAARFNEA